ncbi:MAG: DNA-deoxyinosine glycosylase [Aquincola sp.]|nr:DNA-deoxyinosine glycosylase [Aquincola sp.]MDH5331459.1 DNA-deoxyinosine glycosylase [Aquincola sp.]
MASTTSRGFPPIAAPDARLLILGSLPGQVSLAQRQYYAQPHNAFWRIMGELFGAGLDVPYDERAERLRLSGVALWDVCKAAVRPGSLDASIDLNSVITNDFKRFFRAHPGIVHVCANGGTAHRLYLRRVQPVLPEPTSSLPLHLLPSTSPAHASLRFAQKLQRWRLLEELLAA